ncbi:Tol-Pal system protein YbgF [Campylobacter mucosalis]|uniref:Tol-Pal system protein YbgF n=1 Tax=Campylobacter mucosalis CCUG 21559 TaxID=1032067 RepID=A0A6G5QEZ8_9BACT|nr:hypothetical protein [Campylobacter mucosalis]QCD44265.1 Tol-Pal system protein YbgF [Campylobacter mucosalis CCUG 21559]QKF63540.1 Tol-Pal system protein YbgF [Campylobacter mucosalis]
MKRKILLATFMVASAMSLYAQVSAFDAGNLNTENPYGLTENEKELLKNKRNVQSLQGDLSSVIEQIQGLQSVLDGINSRMSRIEQRISDLELRVNGDATSGGNSIAELKKYSYETRAIQEKNYQKITKTLNQLGALIDKKSTQTINNAKQDTKPTSSNDLSKKDNKTVMSEAVKLFNSNKDQDAKEHFEYLLTKKYQPSASNYYLGEIAYKKKMYSEAIGYYQKSVQGDDKASYMPRLLYHTAISFDKVGDTASANRFYKALKVGYPDTKEAQAAPQRD